MNQPIDASTDSDNNEPLSPLVVHTRVISGQGGGPEKTILNSPRFLKPLGYRGVCVYLRDPNDLGFEIIRQRAAEKQAPLIEVDDFGIRDWRVVGRMGDAIAGILAGGIAAQKDLCAVSNSGQAERDHVQDQPSAGVLSQCSFIWHGHDYKSNLIGLLLRKQFPRMRLVTTVHGWVQKTWKTPLYYAIDKWCLKRYEQVICVSRDLWDDCRKLGVPESRLSLIDNAIALDDYQFDVTRRDAKRTLGFDPDRPLVVAVGRLSDEKGFDLLIDAVADLIDAGRNVQLAIAGDGGFRQPLQQRIEASGHSERIKLLGFVGDPRYVYRAGDLYVLSSYREGLPNVVLEAMAMQLPVVSTRIAGMPDLVVDGENGLLVPTGDAFAIRSAIETVLDDSQRSARLATAGRRTVEDRFSFAARMNRIAGVYERYEPATLDVER